MLYLDRFKNLSKTEWIIIVKFSKKLIWQAILKHKFFIIVIIALALVPAIYNYIFLGSMWDPYGKLNDLPVAVVNLDKTSELNGKKFKLGDDVIAEIIKGFRLSFCFGV